MLCTDLPQHCRPGRWAGPCHSRLGRAAETWTCSHHVSLPLWSLTLLTEWVPELTSTFTNTAHTEADNTAGMKPGPSLPGEEETVAGAWLLASPCRWPPEQAHGAVVLCSPPNTPTLTSSSGCDFGLFKRILNVSALETKDKQWKTFHHTLQMPPSLPCRTPLPHLPLSPAPLFYNLRNVCGGQDTLHPPASLRSLLLRGRAGQRAGVGSADRRVWVGKAASFM